MNYENAKVLLARKETLALLEENTIVTPFPLIEEIIDKLPVRWDNPTLKILDPAMGRGAFLFVVKNRLMQFHSEQHIVENMLFGVDIEENNVAVARAVLNPLGKYNDNLECNDSLKKEWNMKFDVVVGNPPYQKSNGESKNPKYLWPDFVKRAFALSSRHVALIVPKGWTTNMPLYDLIRDHNPMHINVDECAKWFPSVGSTFSYFITQPTKPDQVTIVSKSGSINIPSIPSFGLGVTDPTAFSILQKTSEHDKLKMITSSGYNSSKFSTGCGSVSKTETPTHKYRILHAINNAGREYFYSSHLDTTTHGVPRVVCSVWLSRWKDMFITDDELTSQDFRHFPTNTLAEAKNLRCVLTSSLYTFIATFLSSSNRLTNNAVSNFPAVDLTRSWTDEELYAHFNLTPEEIKLIEDTIK